MALLVKRTPNGHVNNDLKHKDIQAKTPSMKRGPGRPSRNSAPLNFQRSLKVKNAYHEMPTTSSGSTRQSESSEKRKNSGIPKKSSDDGFGHQSSVKRAKFGNEHDSSVKRTPLMRSEITDDRDGGSKDRRKFYIVQSGGSPAEMYCTDLVHKAKHGIGRNKNVDECRLIKCTDRWREEWNHGVQMPISTERPEYVFEPVDLFKSGNAKKPQFLLPKKYVALNDKRYVSATDGFERRSRPPLYYYDIDVADEQWLRSQKSKHIDAEEFLKVMNALEVECYTNIHRTLLEKLTFARDNPTSDDDADCDICYMPEWEPGDEIVFCDNCNVCVHQSCYGLDAVPTDDWMCTTCMHRIANRMKTPPPCVFCPLLGGAMKCSRNADVWAHVACALWIPEVRFGDVERREPISHLSDVPVERWKAKCSVCDTRNGACITCTYPGCAVPFHVACAQRSGLSLKIEQNLAEKNGVSMISLCAKHSSMASPTRRNSASPSKSNTIINFDKNYFSEMTENFTKCVDVTNISNVCEVSQEIVERIFSYWEMKRRRNGNQMLMIEPSEMRLIVLPKEVTAQPRQRPVNVYSSIPSEELLKEFEKVRSIRLNLEKARNLCYMTVRREKLKKSYVETLEQAAMTMGSMLLDPWVPVSKRRTEKLLETWQDAIDQGGPLYGTTELENTCSTSAVGFFGDGPKRSSTGATTISPRGGVEGGQANNINVGRVGPGNVGNSLKESRLSASSPNHHHRLNGYALRHPQPSSPPQRSLPQLPAVSVMSPEEQKRREDMYIFRASTSPLPLAARHFLDEEVVNTCGGGGQSPTPSEYSVAWSSKSGSSSFFDFENDGISPIKLSGDGEAAGSLKKKKRKKREPATVVVSAKDGLSIVQQKRKNGFKNSANNSPPMKRRLRWSNGTYNDHNQLHGVSLPMKQSSNSNNNINNEKRLSLRTSVRRF